MGKFAVYAVATIALASVAATAPAGADQHYGPHAQNGKCFHESPGHGGQMYGYWEACPQTTRTVNRAPCPQDQERSSRGYCRPLRSEMR